MSVRENRSMKLTVSLSDPNSLRSICNWGHSDLVKFSPPGDGSHIFLRLSVEIDGKEFIGFGRSYHDVLLDLLLNHRLILSKTPYRFFVSDEPLFNVDYQEDRLIVWYFDQCKRQITLQEKLSVFDEALMSQCCVGLRLLKERNPDRLRNIFCLVQEDLASRNRADFLS